LARQRYVLAASATLSTRKKRDAVDLIGANQFVGADAIDRDDVDNRLRRHPEIEGRHFELWLASPAVLDRALHSAIITHTAF
jgi:hypothetical protein